MSISTRGRGSVKIIAGILDTMLACESALGVFVSYLSEHILGNANLLFAIYECENNNKLTPK